MIRFLIFILLSSSIILHADKVNINNINFNLPKVKWYYLFSASNHPEIIEAFNMVYASFGQFYGLYVKEESSWKLLSGNTPNHYVTVGIPNGFDEIIFSKEGTEVFFKDMKKKVRLWINSKTNLILLVIQTLFYLLLIRSLFWNKLGLHLGVAKWFYITQ